jgi:hypothetical protein
MVDPASGPFLFDTSAESWLGRTGDPGATDWMRAHLSRHEVHGFQGLLLRWRL